MVPEELSEGGGGLSKVFEEEPGDKGDSRSYHHDFVLSVEAGFSWDAFWHDIYFTD